jgi:anthranilate phosphoribosyltransferase
MEIRKFLEKCVAGEVSLKEQLKFLKKYSPDKIKASELKTFADFMTENISAKVKLPGALDVCGTGGSGLDRINTSTIASFILAELGVKVAKHGNKAASGRFGSFDLLENLGVDINKSKKELEKSFKETGLAFIYARNFHPVMKHFVEARKAFKGPTVFNLLGPLLNPAGAQYQIIGTSFEGQMGLIARTCKLLGKKRVMVVRGCEGLDEVTLTGKTKVVELRNGKIIKYIISPKDFGLENCKFSEIAGGNKSFNLKITKEILEGRCKSRHKDLVLINAALALKLMDQCSCLEEGYLIAKSIVGAGKLASYKGDKLAEIAASKIITPSVRDFKAALNMKGIGVIAEVKKSSPSAGKIFKGKFDVDQIVKKYEKAGVAAISVLTDEKYFQGSFENMRTARKAAYSTPLLCKDFIINEYQIFKAREAGADAILLIASLLKPGTLRKFITVAKSLEMDCLIEVREDNEIQKALAAGAEIIGINNRNLKDFSVDLGTTNRLVKRIPKGVLVVSESGIRGAKDIKMLASRVDAVLIGTALMESKNLQKKLNEIT